LLVDSIVLTILLLDGRSFSWTTNRFFIISITFEFWVCILIIFSTSKLYLLLIKVYKVSATLGFYITNHCIFYNNQVSIYRKFLDLLLNVKDKCYEVGVVIE